jgi:hypothetical protein
MWTVRRRGSSHSQQHQGNVSTTRFLFLLWQAHMLEPDYCQLRLLEIRVGRRLWDSKSYGENVRAFYVSVVKPLRRLQRRGVVKTLQEITATDDKTLTAVEIVGQVDLTKASARFRHTSSDSVGDEAI